MLQVTCFDWAVSRVAGVCLRCLAAASREEGANCSPKNSDLFCVGLIATACGVGGGEDTPGPGPHTGGWLELGVPQQSAGWERQLGVPPDLLPSIAQIFPFVVFKDFLLVASMFH